MWLCLGRVLNNLEGHMLTLDGCFGGTGNDHDILTAGIAITLFSCSYTPCRSICATGRTPFAIICCGLVGLPPKPTKTSLCRTGGIVASANPMVRNIFLPPSSYIFRRLLVTAGLPCAAAGVWLSLVYVSSFFLYCSVGILVGGLARWRTCAAFATYRVD